MLKSKLIHVLFLCLAICLQSGFLYAQQCIEPYSNTVSFWPANNDADDYAGQNDGTLQNGTTYVTGKVGSAFSFDGVNDYVIVQDDPSLHITGNFSIEAWVNVQGSPGGDKGTILFKQNNASCNFNHLDLRVNSTNHLELAITDEGCPGGALILTSPQILHASTWYHIAATYNGATAKIYINGFLVGTKNQVINMVFANTPLSIGANKNNTTSGSLAGLNRFFNGYIDELALYDRTLSDKEIGAIYSANEAGKCNSSLILDRYWIASSAGNWNDANNWSTTSGGLGGATPPKTINNVFFDQNGLGNCNIDADVHILNFQINAGYMGTISQNGKLYVNDFKMYDGTFNGGDEEITIYGDYIQEKGTFKSTTARLLFYNNVAFYGENFLHNNGSVRFLANDGTSEIDVTNIRLFHVWISNNNNAIHTFSASSKLIVEGELTLGNSSSTVVALKGGIIDVYGNITLNDNGGGYGSVFANKQSLIRIVGDADQSIIDLGSTSTRGFWLPNIEIDKPSGTLLLNGEIAIYGDWNFINGSLDATTNCPTLSFMGFGGRQILGKNFEVNNLEIKGAFGSNTRTTLDPDLEIITYGDLSISGQNLTNTIGGTIKVNGNFYNNTTSTGVITTKIVINGENDQHINSSSNTTSQKTIGHLVIDKISGNAILDNDIIISSVLELNNGILFTTASAKPILKDNVVTINASKASYIDGPMSKIGNDAFTFNIGKNGNYQPISISAPQALTDMFTAEYFDSQITSTYIASGLKGVSTCEHWNLNRENGTSSVKATLGWNQNSCKISQDINDMRVAVYTPQGWSDGGQNLLSGSSIEGTITSDPLSTYGKITYGYTRLFANGCEGPYSSRNNVTDGSGAISWFLMGTVETSDDQYVSVENAPVNKWTDYLEMKELGFNIPPSATIEGVEVSVERFQKQGTGKNINSDEVALIKNGSKVRPSKSGGDWPESDEVAVYGSSSDLWTGTGWTPSEINDPNFGVAIRVKPQQQNMSFLIDQISMKVCYTDPDNPPPFLGVYYSTASGDWSNPATWSTVSYTSDVNIGSYPKSGDIVYIKDHTINITGTETAQTVKIDNPELFNTNIIVNDGASLAVEQDLIVASGQTLNSGDKNADIELSGNGQLIVSGKTTLEKIAGKGGVSLTLRDQSKFINTEALELITRSGSKGVSVNMMGNSEITTTQLYVVYQGGKKGTELKMNDNAILHVIEDIVFRSGSNNMAGINMLLNSTLYVGGNIIREGGRGYISTNPLENTTIIFNGATDQIMASNQVFGATDRINYNNVYIEKETSRLNCDNNIVVNRLFIGYSNLYLNGNTIEISNTEDGAFDYYTGRIVGGVLKRTLSSTTPHTYPMQNEGGSDLIAEITPATSDLRTISVEYTEEEQPVIYIDKTQYTAGSENIKWEMTVDEEEKLPANIEVSPVDGISKVWVKNTRTENYMELPASNYILNQEKTKAILGTNGIKTLSGTINALSICYYDKNKNWIISKNYNYQEDLIGTSAGYYDDLGKPIQSQVKNFTENEVFATETVYDAYGRAAISTLQAPVDQEDLCYKQYFIRAETVPGFPSVSYDYTYFDTPNNTASSSTVSPGEVYNPIAINGYNKGTLGWYYSDYNDEEPFVASSKFPYVRVEYDDDNMGGITRNTIAGDEYKMGQNHETQSYTMPAAGELYYVYGYARGWTASAENSEDLSYGGYDINNNLVVDHKVNKVISVDQNNREIVQFFDTEGKLLVSARSGQSGLTRGGNMAMKSCPNNFGYIDIHIPEGCENSVSTSGVVSIYDLKHNKQVQLNGNSYFTGNIDGLSPGYYRIKGSCVTYQLNYYDFSANYYDRANHLILSVPPQGFDAQYVPTVSTQEGSTVKNLYPNTNNGWSLAASSIEDEMYQSIPPASNDNSKFTVIGVELLENTTLISGGNIAQRIAQETTDQPEGRTPLENSIPLGLGSEVYAEQTLIEQAEIQTRQGIGGAGPAEPLCGPNTRSLLVQGMGGPVDLTKLCKDDYGQYPYGLYAEIVGPPTLISGGSIYCYTCRERLGDGSFKLKYTIDYQVWCNYNGGTLVADNRQMIAILDENDHWRFSYLPGYYLVQDGMTHSVVDLSTSEGTDQVYLKVIGIEEVKQNPLDPSDYFIATDYDRINELKIGLRTTTFDLQGNYPDHRMASSYDYNSLGWLLSNETPDAGRSEFVYREDGQIRFSQNARQAAVGPATFSYTHYDNIGRPIEFGEYNDAGQSGTVAFQDHKQSHTIPGNFSTTTLGILNNTYTLNKLLNDQDHLNDAYCNEQTYIQYDYSDNTLQPETGLNYIQHHLLKSVAKSWVKKNGTVTSTSWYSYDALGRTEWVVQKIDGLGTKTLHYTYDSKGNLSKVELQKGVPGEYFAHRYFYDADLRLSRVETSDDGSTWLEQAEYDYYLHGPLKRVELANDLQGIDYVYTINGWLKAINHPDLDYADAELNDPGYDGYAGENQSFAKDAFGMLLDYHQGDYMRGSIPRAMQTNPNVAEQFNGNIASQRWRINGQESIINIDDDQQWMYKYSYDRNNWLAGARFGTYNPTRYYNFGGTQVLGHPIEHLSEDYRVKNISYDKNGNLQSLDRNGYEFFDVDGCQCTVTRDMDNIRYNYAVDADNRRVNNQLTSVDDLNDNTITNLYQDIRDQQSGNYVYDPTGQLIYEASENNAYVYNVSGKVDGVYKAIAGTSQPDLTKPKVKFYYNEAGMRVRKESFHYITHALVKTTYYLHDAGGGLTAIYDTETGAPVQQELSLNGAGRIGVYYRQNPDYSYQLTDHLGNVRAVVNTNDYTGGEIILNNTFDNNSLDGWQKISWQTGVYNSNDQLWVLGNNYEGVKNTFNTTSGILYNVSLNVRPYNNYPLKISVVSQNNVTLDSKIITPNNLSYQKVYLRFVANGNNTTIKVGPANSTGGVYDPANFFIDNVIVTTQKMVRPATYADYYPFGMVMPGRHQQSSLLYRYAFQGQEKDGETGKEAFELRLWDGRIGRWLTTDPANQYFSSYEGMGNNPINRFDPNGGFDSYWGAFLYSLWVNGKVSKNDNGTYNVFYRDHNGYFAISTEKRNKINAYGFSDAWVNFMRSLDRGSRGSTYTGRTWESSFDGTNEGQQNEKDTQNGLAVGTFVITAGMGTLNGGLELAKYIASNVYSADNLVGTVVKSNTGKENSPIRYGLNELSPENGDFIYNSVGITLDLLDVASSYHNLANKPTINNLMINTLDKYNLMMTTKGAKSE